MLVEVVGHVELQDAEGPEAGAQLPRQLVQEPPDLPHRVAQEVGALVLQNPCYPTTYVVLLLTVSTPVLNSDSFLLYSYCYLPACSRSPRFP